MARLLKKEGATPITKDVFEEDVKKDPSLAWMLKEPAYLNAPSQ